MYISSSSPGTEVRFIGSEVFKMVTLHLQVSLNMLK